MVAGEDESKAGCVDIRSRDNQRLGKMRVDDLAKFFKEQLPKPSSSFDSKYVSAWKAEDYPVVAVADAV